MSCIDHKNETVMINLSIEESELARQVETSEIRAKISCPVHDDSDLFWKKANSMIKNMMK